MLDIAATCLVVTALLAWLNHRFVRLPTTIGVMVIALGLSLAIVALDAAGVAQSLLRYEESLLRSIDFSDVLMQGMLSLLLFAGALHVDLSELKALRWPVGGAGAGGHAAVDGRSSASAIWLVLPWMGLPHAAAVLPAVRRADLAHRPDRGDGHPEVGRRAEEPGTGDRRRVAVQRRRRRGDLRAAAGHAGQRRRRPRPVRRWGCCCTRPAAASCSAWRWAT